MIKKTIDELRLRVAAKILEHRLNDGFKPNAMLLPYTNAVLERTLKKSGYTIFFCPELSEPVACRIDLKRLARL
jgi:hypothetical protein